MTVSRIQRKAPRETPRRRKLTDQQVRENLREFLYLIRHAEVLVDLERMTRKRDEAPSKRQKKKLDKQIKKKRAKCSATYILNQILREERARTEK